MVIRKGQEEYITCLFEKLFKINQASKIIEPMKLSYYKTTSKPINENGDTILYSFVTNEMLKISQKVSHDIDAGNIDNLSSELKNKLIEMKVLLEDGVNELEEIVIENTEEIAASTIFHFTVFPSGNCQLGCHYCGQSHSPSKLSIDLHEPTLKYIDTQLSLKKYTDMHISWFGGEPMLGLETIKTLTPEIKKLAQKYDLGYSSRITTNGLLLNEKNFEILIQNGVKDMTISLDGAKEYHDVRRMTKGGNGSFDVIMNNLISVSNKFRLDELGVLMTLRINVDKFNEDGVMPLLELCKEKKLQFARFDIAPIHSWGNDAHLRSFSRADWGKKKIDYYIQMYQMGLLKSFQVPQRVKEVCMAVVPGARYMEHTGKLFDCSETPLVKSYTQDYSIGHIVDFKEDKKRHFLNWNEEVYANKYPCGTCKIFPICGGGCPKEWKEGHEPCPDYKEYIDEYITLSYLTALES